MLFFRNIGIAVATFLFFWMPFFVYRFAHGMLPWWRVPVIRGVLFDTPMYLEWVGYLQAGIPFGKNLGWFALVIRGVNVFSLGQLSIAEVWLVTAWLSATLSAYAMWYVVRKRLEVDARAARWIVVAWWMMVVAHVGWRPGVYSWYLPVGILAISCLFLAEQQTIFVRRVGYCVAAVALAAIYPWFLIPIGLWAAALLMKDRGRTQQMFMWIVGSVVTSIAAVVLAFSPDITNTLQILERSGLGFSHLPFLTTAVLLSLGWLVFFGVCIRGQRTHERVMHQLALGWLVIFFCFELTPFTGIVFQNDHFRGLSLIVSWISFASVYAFLQRTDHQDVSPRASWNTWILRILTLFSGTMVVWKATIFFLSHTEDLAFVQVAYWVPFFLASIIVLFPHKKKRILCIGASICIILGLLSTANILRREFSDPPELRMREDVSRALASLVRVHDTICIDPLNADRIAASTPRLIIPARTYRFIPESDAVQQTLLETLARGFNLAHASTADRDAFHQLVRQDRYLPCSHFAWADKSLSSFTGCPRERIEHDWASIQTASREGLATEQQSRAFEHACPWVVVMPGLESTWHLPSSATLHELPDGVRLYSTQ